MRKSASTYTIKNCPSKSASVASLQTHSERTAEKYYRLINKEEVAVIGRNALKDLYGARNEGEAMWPHNVQAEVMSLFKQEIGKKFITMDVVRQK